MSELDQAILVLVGNPREVAKVAVQTLFSIAEKIIHTPKEEKYRRIKQSNGAVKRKVTDVPGGGACLRALGFREVEHEGELVWYAAPEGGVLDKLVDGKARLAVELDRLYDTAIDAEKSQKANGPGGIEGMIANALQDPLSLQRLLQNPMVAQMARANPEMVESAAALPAVQQTLQANPEMRQQIEQLTGRPLPVPATPGPAASPAPAAGGAQHGYAAQLQQLREMGFYDEANCIRALEAAGGDVEVALASLVGT
mmetsp:Transcript_5063/g.10215  ORF Transcript_5063/g.10215 Transcript_5063/m.10215 type:complete len:255 (-) Transcript_5063:92-856(-)